MLTAGDPLDLVADVERRLEELERLPDRAARETATAVVQSLLELYGVGLERIVDAVAASPASEEIAVALAEDELVAHLLLVHGLHPVPLEARVRDALGEVRPYLESHGGDVELLAIEDGEVHLRLDGSCSGCPSSTMTLKLAIENAIRKAAPEIEAVVADPGITPGPADLLQISIAPGVAAPRSDAPDGEWAMAGGLPELSGGGMTVRPVAGRPILFLRLPTGLYAYAPECPACGAGLAGATLEGAELRCDGCGRRYDAMRAGRCLDAPQLHLEPVPLLVGAEGLVKVAVAVA